MHISVLLIFYFLFFKKKKKNTQTHTQMERGVDHTPPPPKGQERWATNNGAQRVARAATPLGWPPSLIDF
jgi:hypothetical protein